LVDQASKELPLPSNNFSSRATERKGDLENSSSFTIEGEA